VKTQKYMMGRSHLHPRLQRGPLWLLSFFLVGWFFFVATSKRRGGEQALLRSQSSQLAENDSQDLERWLTIANFTYENQKLERARSKDVSASLAVFQANWPCLWGEAVTGYMPTWQKQWDRFKDGWKFTCGLQRIRAPCVIYSLGSAGNMAFEKGVLEDNPACTIYIYDKDQHGIDQWFSEDVIRAKKVNFNRYFIGAREDAHADPPVRTLTSIMAELGHTHIDILKMDIEGAEWDVLTDASRPLPSIGQLLVEVHEKREKTVSQRVSSLTALFNNLEANGLRLFHQEINARYDMHCIEYAFIQSLWRPDRKTYQV
jgi:hypothetical protein